LKPFNATSLSTYLFSSLTAGFGVFGSAVGVILVSVPASETLTNEVSMRYTRDRWSTVSDALRLSVKIQSITISSQILSSSLDSTSSQNSAIGEAVNIEKKKRFRKIDIMKTKKICDIH
jgi:hypothetical protein